MKFGGRTAAAIIVFPDNRILLVKRATVPFKGYWALPGGKVDARETVEETVVREVKEETGIDVEIVNKIGEYHEKGAQGGIEYDYYPTCFLVKPIGGTIKRQENEIEHAKLFNLKEIPDRLAFEHASMLHDYILLHKHKDNDFSLLDRPEILGVIFYPRKSRYIRSSKSNARNHFVEVERGIRIGCRFYVRGPDCPSLLYFHGNGEIVDDYDWSAPFYSDIGINLFVADYRGYGFSDGKPTISNMIEDSHPIFEQFVKIVEEYGSRKSLFVMGRSIGSIPAIEVVHHHQDNVQGLIIESGSANNFRYFFSSSFLSNHPIWSDDSKFLNKVKLRSILKPTLIIHAEWDTIVPLEEGEELYKNSGAKDKLFLVIPNADHNDVMVLGKEQYFKAIKQFVKTHS